MKRISNVPLYIALVVMCGIFAYYLFVGIKWVIYPHSIDFGEGFVISYAQQWQDGTWNWDINVPPYMTMVYGLGYPLLMQPLISIFGAELWLARLVSFIASLVVCVFLYLIANKITGKKIISIIIAMLPALHPIFRDWAPLARVDMIAVMFEVIGIYIFVRFKDSKWLYIAIVPFLLAIMVKLSAVAGLVAVVIYLLITKRHKFVVFTLITLSCMSIIFAFLMAVSNGEYINHVLVYQNTIENFDIPILMVNFMMFFPAFISLFLLAIFYIRRYTSKRKLSFIAIYFIAAIILNMFLTLRPGAAGMYYFEAIISGCLCAGLFLNYLYNHHKKQAIVMLSAFILVFFAIYGWRTTMPFPDKQYAEDIKTVQSIISDTDKPIVTENSCLVMDVGKELYIETFIFTNLARLGYWDDTEYINDYKSQYFDYVVLKVSLEQKEKYEDEGYPDSNFTSETIEAIKDNYTLVWSNEKENQYEITDTDWRCLLNVYEANRRIK